MGRLSPRRGPTVQPSERIDLFYRAFQRRDGATMAACYTPDATFRDPVFALQGERVGAMWRMLCERGKDLRVEFSDVRADGEVDAFLATLQHPARDLVVALRRLVLDADASIAEGIKWNAPSFRTRDWFATTHLRMKAGIGLILHFGAKKNAIADSGVAIPDPGGLLDWLARDRAMILFRDLDDLAQ
ncbi:MAG TPA: nuclear transport factor 2 family protein, partial [Tahibacter sp.]|nr:nuclear transport factor 2 family protein [Tahibacter sp.]